MPIIKKEINCNINVNILEVGNVLSYYFSVEYVIVDKFNRFSVITRKDIFTN